MSFRASEWSDDEKPAPVTKAAVAPKKKYKLIRRTPAVAADGAMREAAVTAKIRQKRGRDDDDDGDAMRDSASTTTDTKAPKAEKGTTQARKRMRDNSGKAVPPAPPTPHGVGKFHTVMDPQYSDVCLPRPGADPKLRSGAWIGAVCHCLQCEATRVAQKMSTTQKTTLVIVDLDNFGYPQWVKHPAPSSVAQAGEAPGNIFFWCFYGLGFAEYGQKGDPEDAVAGKSLFGSLKRTGQVHFSPCGNYPQAADLAMQAVVGVMRNVHIGVVTADKPHIKACHNAYLAQKLLPGRTKKLFQTFDPSQCQNDGNSLYKSISEWNIVTQSAE